MVGEHVRARRLWWGAVGAIALLGLALRVAAAQGGLWTDEAWSMIYAGQARDAAGVFLRINHDNNHHLYSLWMQWVGPTASPLLVRAPAILAGSLGAVVAALILERRSRTAALLAALLFAVSPTLIVFGSEARGYAMMLLAALLMLLLAARAVERRPVSGSRWWLAGLAMFGMFSHLTMAAPMALVTLWFYLERRRADGPRAAFGDTLRLMGPGLAASAAAAGFVLAAAAASPSGMRIGGYVPFDGRDYVAALDDLGLWSLGLSLPVAWIVPSAIGVAALALAWRPPAWLGARGRLYALLILGVPVGIALTHSGNAGFPRYYLISVVGLLLLAAEWLARGLASTGAVRAAALAALGAMMTASAVRDATLVSLARGHPEAALRDISAMAPIGARVAAEPRLRAMLAVEARRTNYPIHYVGGCAPADFELAAQRRWTSSPPTIERCGVTMRAVDSTVITPLTGDAWVLYRAESLQRPKPPVSGPLRARTIAAFSGRAGVAQG